jgi:phosphate uptake regulator
VYRSGCDEFKIIFDNSPEKKRYSAFSYNTVNLLHTQEGSNDIVLSPIEVVQAMINRCIGVEIIDQRENWCIVKELGETTYKEFDNALRRVFLLLISMAEEINKTIKPHADKESLKSAHIIDTNIDRFTDFCFRVLSKKGYQEYRKTPTMHSILFVLEMMGDEFKKVAIHLLEAKSISQKMESLFKIQSDQLRRYYTLFYGFNRERCLEIYEQDQKGHKYNLGVYESLNTAEKEILHHLKKIGIYILSLTELRIDLEY